MKLIKYFQILSLVLLTFLLACKPKEDTGTPASSYLVEYKLIDEVTVQEVVDYMGGNDIVTIIAKYPFKVYRVTYLTQATDANPTMASGVVMIPEVDGPKPIASVQKGTTFSDAETPSTYGEASVAKDMYLFAAAGYVLSVPDYLGYGVSSHFTHPFQHAASLAINSTDMLRAAREICTKEKVELSDKLFLAGYSEGGYATVAMQKYIEERLSNEFKITAVSAGAGAYDMFGTASAYIAAPDEPLQTTAFIAFVLRAYNTLYLAERPMEELFNPPYAGYIEDGLLDGGYSLSEIDAKLPKTLRQLLNPQFLANFANGETEMALRQSLSKNNVFAWVPKSPLRLYHGNADKIVPFNNSQKFYDYVLKKGGTTVELFPVDGQNHDGGAFGWAIGTASWFEELKKK